MNAVTNFGVVCGSEPCRCGEGFISLKVKEVEGFLTGTRHPRDGVTVSECEAQLHIHLKKGFKKGKSGQGLYIMQQGRRKACFLYRLY